MPKIAYTQMKVVAGHPDINTKKILQFIDEAKNFSADVVIFPDWALSGFLVEKPLAEKECHINDCLEWEKEIVAASKNITVIIADTYKTSYGPIFIAKNGKYVSCGDDFFDSIVIACGDNEYYRVGIDYLGKNQADKFDFFIDFFATPFSLNKDFMPQKKHLNCPIIRVAPISVQNDGKNIYVYGGVSAVLNSHGKPVQYIEPFKEGLNIVDLETIDKMPVIKLPKVSEAEKIYRALSYGVKEFLAQISMNKVVIGVSGGIDSAVAAALYTQVVGAENVYLVNMPSKFNSATTKNLSEQLAKNLGCKYFVVPIQESVDWTVKQLNDYGIEVSDFVKENIQARDRSSRILAAIAASIGGVFTCNANKAETTVGYATLYGDEAGFLSALADLWKYQVYDLARYMNEEIYKREVIPQGIIDIVPSAELSTAQNVDEGKGDPLKYPYHDYLFRAFAENGLTPEEILNYYKRGKLEKEISCQKGLVDKYFPTAQDFIDDLERWWKQFTGMGVAKRIQSPPIIAVTDNPYGARLESQNSVYFTKKYLELKKKLLAR